MSNPNPLAELAALLMLESSYIQHSPTLRPPYYAEPAPHIVAEDAAALMRLAKACKRRAVSRLNGIERWDASERRMKAQWTEADKVRADLADAAALAKAAEIAKRYLATAEIGGDPRGFALRLHLQSGRTNGFSQDGWGIA